MNTDFRLSIGIFEHPKVRKLKRQLGAEGVLAYLCLLRFTAQNKPDGDLTGMDCDDIALAADYDGDPCQFLDVLTALRLIDRDMSGVRVHDWADHNPYAAHAPARAEKAKNAAKARWDKSSNAQAMPEDARSTPPQCSEHDLAMPQASFSNAPSPDPSPDPKKEQDSGPKAAPVAPNADPKQAPSLLAQRFEVFWAAYPKKVSKGDALRVWNRMRPTQEFLETILAALEWQSVSLDWTKEGRKYCPYPATYLNAQGWLDEPDPAIRSPSAPESPPRVKSYDPAADFAREFGPAARSAA